MRRRGNHEADRGINKKTKTSVLGGRQEKDILSAPAAAPALRWECRKKSNGLFACLFSCSIGKKNKRFFKASQPPWSHCPAWSCWWWGWGSLFHRRSQYQWGLFKPIVEAQHWASCVVLLWVALSFRGITLGQKVKAIMCEGRSCCCTKSLILAFKQGLSLPLFSPQTSRQSIVNSHSPTTHSPEGRNFYFLTACCELVRKNWTFNRDENVRILEHCGTMLWCTLTPVSWKLKRKSKGEKRWCEILFYYACTLEQPWQNADFMNHSIEFKGFPLGRRTATAISFILLHLSLRVRPKPKSCIT